VSQPSRSPIPYLRLRICPDQFNAAAGLNMGKFVKNHWARLIILTAAVFQIGASIEGFIWPKIFWDFSTTVLDPLVRPIPFLQITNVLLGLTVIAFEWPLTYLTRTTFHRNILPRILVYPICSFAALLMYQSTDGAMYYLIGTGAYIWALNEGEVCYSAVRPSSRH
jgi:hypothetical protein